MKVYISGKITGLELPVAQFNFSEVEKQLIELGHEPINPLSDIEHSRSWEQHMVRDIELLLGCDAIMLMDNWMFSTGSRIEKYIAEERKMKIMFASEQVLEGSVQWVKNAVKTVTGIDFEKFTIKSRKRELFFARTLFIKMVDDFDVFSSAEIGELTHRSKSDVNYALRTYENEYKLNKKFRDMADKINQILNPKP